MTEPKVQRTALDSMIWMSYRYAIGRHTIAAWYHAKDLLVVISDNKDILGKNKIEMYTRDIRETCDFHKKCGYPEDLDVWYDLVDKLEELIKD